MKSGTGFSDRPAPCWRAMSLEPAPAERRIRPVFTGRNRPWGLPGRNRPCTCESTAL